MDKNRNTAAGGVSSTTVLQIVFLVLKLTNLINWSWFWVLSPTIFSVAIAGTALGIASLVLGVREAKRKREIKTREDNSRKEQELKQEIIRQQMETIKRDFAKQDPEFANDLAKANSNTTVKQNVRPAYIREEDPSEYMSGPSLKMGKSKNNMF